MGRWFLPPSLIVYSSDLRILMCAVGVVFLSADSSTSVHRNRLHPFVPRVCPVPLLYACSCFDSSLCSLSLLLFLVRIEIVTAGGNNVVMSRIPRIHCSITVHVKETGDDQSLVLVSRSLQNQSTRTDISDDGEEKKCLTLGVRMRERERKKREKFILRL